MKRLLAVSLMLTLLMALSFVAAGPADAALAWTELPTMVAAPAMDTFDGVSPILSSVMNPATAASFLFLMGTVANAPKKRAKAAPLHTGNIPVEQKDDIRMPPLGESVERIPDRIQLIDSKALTPEYLAALAMAEEPITIIIARPQDPKNISRCTDLVEINGIKAEILFKNGWVPFGWLPLGMSFTTKRKYAEVLARAKQDNIQHQERFEQVGEDPVNIVQRHTSVKTPFTVLKDDNPRGAEWLLRIISSQA